MAYRLAMKFCMHGVRHQQMTTDFVRRRPNTQIENLRIGNYDFHSYREHFKTSLKDVLKL